MTTLNAFQTSLSEPSDAFVLKLDPAGQVLYSTYFGGPGDESGNAIAVDPSGKIYVTGFTTSSTIPGSPHPDGTFMYAGFKDVFLAKFDPSLSGTGSLVYFTYLGGTNNDEARSVAVDRQGNIYVTGMTFSNDFPTAGAHVVPMRFAHATQLLVHLAYETLR